MIDDYLTEDVKKILLIEPDFPIYVKSRNKHHTLPIGLLKLAGYFRNKGIGVKLVRFNDNDNKIDFVPDLICVSSLFSYWSKYVRDVVLFYKNCFSDVPILVGGIYASLLPVHCKEYTKCDYVIKGVIPEVEKVTPAYDLVDVDFQILHTTRGCIRNCEFCGVNCIEPEFSYKKSIKDEIFKKKIVFYDNNLLANPYIDNILDELILLKKQRKINYVESQCGFDGRLLLDKPHLAEKLYFAGFKNVKIAWDGGIEEADSIHDQLHILFNVGFKPRDISVFMISNFHVSFNELEQKRVKCFEWGVQITVCRYRPLSATYDDFNPRMKEQTNSDYFIHPLWTDKKIRLFNRHIRRHNVCVRYQLNYFSEMCLRKKIPYETANKDRYSSFDVAKTVIPDSWNPRIHHYSDGGV